MNFQVSNLFPNVSKQTLLFRYQIHKNKHNFSPLLVHLNQSNYRFITNTMNFKTLNVI